MTQHQIHSASSSLIVACFVAFCLTAAWAGLAVAGVTAPMYTLQVSAVVQAPSRAASLRAAGTPIQMIRRWIAEAGVDSVQTVSQAQATLARGGRTSNWLTVVHYDIASRDLGTLEQLQKSIQRRTPWRVVDIDRGGEFVPVLVRPGVTELRLAQTVGTADAGVHVRLQLSGPNVAFSTSDILPLLLIAFLVFGFGATEHNKTDVFAFPRGMHPVIVASQIVTLSLFACVLIDFWKSGELQINGGLLVLDVAVAVSIGRWLWISRQYWTDAPIMLRARPAIIAFVSVLCFAGMLLGGGIV